MRLPEVHLIRRAFGEARGQTKCLAEARTVSSVGPQMSLAPDGIIGELVGTASQLTGTAVSADSSLMSVGFDSVSATEFSTSLSVRLETNMPSTLLFDHPSI